MDTTGERVDRGVVTTGRKLGDDVLGVDGRGPAVCDTAVQKGEIARGTNVVCLRRMQGAVLTVGPMEGPHTSYVEGVFRRRQRVDAGREHPRVRCDQKTNGVAVRFSEEGCGWWTVEVVSDSF